MCSSIVWACTGHTFHAGDRYVPMRWKKINSEPKRSPCFGFPTTKPECLYSTSYKVSRNRLQGGKREISSLSAVFYATFLIPCLPYPPQPGFLSMLLLSVLGLGTVHSCCAPRARSVWPLCGTEDHGMVDDRSVHMSTGFIPSPHLGSKQLCKKGLLEELG